MKENSMKLFSPFEIVWFLLERTYYRNDSERPAIALRILSQSSHNFVLIYFFVSKYVHCLYNMPNKRRLVTSKICFGSKEAGLLENSYHKCALAFSTELRKKVFALWWLVKGLKLTKSQANVNKSKCLRKKL